MANLPTCFMAGDLIVSDETVPTLKRTLDPLGSGIHRTAYALSEDYVLKVGSNAYGYDGASANRKETDSWLAIADTEYAQHFAPVVAASPSGYWIVSARVRFIANDMPASYRDGYASWRANVLRTLERELYLSDTHGGNIGFTGTCWVVIDYGFGLNQKADNSWSIDIDNVEWSDALDGSCHCSDCRRELHEAMCTVRNASHPSRSCDYCGAVSCGCDATQCVIRRNSQWCDADDAHNCGERIAYKVTMPNGSRLLFCSRHRPIIATLPNNHDWPRLFSVNHVWRGLPDETLGWNPVAGRGMWLDYA